MKQAISGVSPVGGAESTIMTVWPSMGRTPFGQLLGRLYGIKAGIGNVLTVGNLIALASIPQALLLFFLALTPWACLRYRLTNRRIVVERGFIARVEKEVSLDNFDTIEVVVAPGQEWYPCGNLVFYKGKVETFRIDGIPHLEGFRHTCLNAQRGFAGVKSAGAKKKVAAK
ncbi:MAG: PH domain-containing protein [Planctomycetia bacterium]|nr:PH domain-containing protein [Planctomycetia bacterium]